MSRCLLWTVLMLALVTACETGPSTSDRDLTVIDYERLVQLMRDHGDRLVLVDVRSPDRYAEGHIPGAINIPLPAMRSGDERLAEAEHIVVYGHDWQSMLSPAGAKKLLVLGYQNVYDFRGGLEMWRLQAREVAAADGGDPAAD